MEAKYYFDRSEIKLEKSENAADFPAAALFAQQAQVYAALGMFKLVEEQLVPAMEADENARTSN